MTLEQTAQLKQTGPRRLWIISLIVLLGLTLGVNLSSLAQYPQVHCDEAFLTDIGFNFMTMGQFRLDLQGDSTPLSINHPWVSRLSQIFLGSVYLIGGSTFFSARLATTVSWLTATAFVFLAGRELYGQFAGGLSALVFASGVRTFYASHLARNDMWVVAAAVGLFYYYLMIRREPTRMRFLFLSLLCCLAVELHDNAIWFDLPLGCLVIIDNYKTAEGRVRIGWFTLGGILGLVLLFALHLLPSPSWALAQLNGPWAQDNSLWSGGPLERLRDSMSWLVNSNIYGLGGIVLPFTLCAVGTAVYALLRHEASDRLLLFVIGASLFVFVFGQGHKSTFYGILWDGYWALVIGGAASRIGQTLLERWRWLGADAVAFLILAPLIALNLAEQVWLSVKFDPRDYAGYTAAIQTLVPPDAAVVGNPTLWFAFHNRNQFVSTSYLVNERQVLKQTGPLDVNAIRQMMSRLGPTYVVADGTVGCSNVSDNWSQIFGIYLEESCQKLGRVENLWFGANGQNINGSPTEVYACQNSA